MKTSDQIKLYAQLDADYHDEPDDPYRDADCVPLKWHESTLLFAIGGVAFALLVAAIWWVIRAVLA